jgi:hypothetical protein
MLKISGAETRYFADFRRKKPIQPQEVAEFAGKTG